VQVLRDNETYSSSVYEGIMGLVMGRTILQMDEPEHRIARALVSSSFRSKVLERWEESLVARCRQRADRLLLSTAARPTWCVR
jgi:cytochrome P450